MKNSWRQGKTPGPSVVSRSQLMLRDSLRDHAGNACSRNVHLALGAWSGQFSWNWKHPPQSRRILLFWHRLVFHKTLRESFWMTENPWILSLQSRNDLQKGELNSCRHITKFIFHSICNLISLSISLCTKKHKQWRKCIKIPCSPPRGAVLLSPGQDLRLVLKRRLLEHCQHIHHVCAEIMSGKKLHEDFLKTFAPNLISSWVILRGSIFERYVPASVWGMEAFLFVKLCVQNSLWRL